MGTLADDWVFSLGTGSTNDQIDAYQNYLGFDHTQYGGSVLNTGPDVCDRETLRYLEYNGMKLGYTGAPERSLGAVPNDGDEDVPDYEVFTLAEATEDLIVWLTGRAAALIQIYWDVPDKVFNNTGEAAPRVEDFNVQTQTAAQKTLVTVAQAIVKKDQIRAHLGALQNRFENTMANLTSQAENLQASESRISDVDVAREMTEFVKNQVLAQASRAIRTQANSYPQMLAGLLNE